MKKFLNLGLLFLSISGSIISCASDNEIITQENNVINNLTESTLQKVNGKDNFIIIDAATVTSSWVTNNSNFIVDSTATTYTVDLDAVYNNCSGSCDTAVSNWLNANDYYIDFDASYTLIEDVHTVESQTSWYPQQNNQVLMTVHDFYTILNTTLGTKEVAEINDTYNYYISFSIANNQLNLQQSSYYPYSSCYSVALLKSLLSVNQIDEHSSQNILFTEQGSSIYIQISRGTDVLTYDYTDDPTLCK
ncbi:hypothetical protein [Neptunitalea lumnitzerae]|uniref:Lipoprotein n=1 Tax=Neptunitalea lumnitzerae TaxID=2965509 RepID=A0ABQ5ML00_9FLAO|nr:hypothetical protein [Neptunitalea sp. Y10]GLB50049.1 hypothetical protein Y10_24170 [Neptunitalea sp. Y10]